MKLKKIANLKTSALVLVLATFMSTSYLTTAVALGTPADPPAGSSFDQRLAQRKTEQAEQLDANTTKRVQSICGAEQSSVRQLQPHTASVANNRTATYQTIDGIILISIGQLKLGGLDTFNLEQDRTAFVGKVSAFQDTFNNYQQALGDILVINCQADPVGFQALLDTARVYYGQLTTESTDIANYLNNTMQPDMQSYVNQLQLKSNASS